MEQPNLNYINELSGDDEVFKQKMIAIVKTELPQEIESYQSLLKSQNFIAAAEMVHKLKHKISVLGLEKSYYLAQTFEENLKNNNIQLQNDFEFILERMSNFVTSLK